MVSRGKHAQMVGYAVERDCVNYYRSLGAFAIRIGKRAEKGILRAIDVVAFYQGIFYIIQCKRRKKYLHREEKLRIKMAATQFGAYPLLCYRDNGLKFEMIK